MPFINILFALDNTNVIKINKILVLSGTYVSRTLEIKY